jgi:acyl-CoA synthetase (NDP forming)
VTSNFKSGDRILSAALDEHQAKLLLQAYDIPTVRERVAHDKDQALAAARELGYPAAVKGLGARLLHKTERGLVRLNIQDDIGMLAAVKHIQAQAGDDLEGLLVQSQVPGQREFMAGLFQDPQFGPVIMFGVGGVLTEAIADVVLALAPLTPRDANEMINGVKAQLLLGAFRGEAAVDANVLSEILMAISRLATEHPEIGELDINPLKIDGHGHPWAVDALVVTRSLSKPEKKLQPVPPKAIGKLLYPRSIAFIGASAQMGKWGHMLVANTISGGYKGRIYLVNPKGGTIMGRPAFKQITDIPDPVDLAVVTVPAHQVIDLIRPLRTKGVPAMVLISSGFKEIGEHGTALEDQLIAAARQAGILVLGPNTMGITNPHLRLFCTGARVKPRAGAIAMVAQSGNMGSQLLTFAEKQGIGIRGFVGSGNEAMITIEDYIEGFEVDELTRVVILYIESIKQGRRFYEAARRLSAKKPIVLLKGGQSEAGSKAAAGHTGAMASNNRVFEAVCRQAGIIKVDAPMDLLDLAAAFDSLPLPRGPRVAIMTWGGGWGVVTADLCQSHGLVIPVLDKDIIARLDDLLPAYWSRANPMDLVGEQDLSLPLTCLEALMQWDGCDAVINLGILGRIQVAQRMRKSILRADPQADIPVMDAVYQTVLAFEKEFIARSVALMTQCGKPVIGVSILSGPKSQTVYRHLKAAHKAVFYETPERAVQTLAKMVAYQRYLVSIQK